jgi:hypothetical protein
VLTSPPRPSQGQRICALSNCVVRRRRPFSSDIAPDLISRKATHGLVQQHTHQCQQGKTRSSAKGEITPTIESVQSPLSLKIQTRLISSQHPAKNQQVPCLPRSLWPRHPLATRTTARTKCLATTPLDTTIFKDLCTGMFTISHTNSRFTPLNSSNSSQCCHRDRTILKCWKNSRK